MRLLLTIVLAVAASALAAFLALFVCALAGFAQVTLAHGVLAAVPMAALSLLVHAVASRSRRAPAALKTSLRLLVALSLLPLTTLVIAEVAAAQPSWMRGWNSASAAVTAVVCSAIAAGQWAVFRWRASRAGQASPIRFGRQP